MTVACFDSSAFVKLLVEEEGSDLAATLWDAAAAVMASRLADPEVRAALAAAQRDGRLTERREAHAVAEWADYWGQTEVIELTPAIAASAGELASRHSLGGADAVHLGSALAVGAAEPLVVTWDRRLWTGARDAGLDLAPDLEDRHPPPG